MDTVIKKISEVESAAAAIMDDANNRKKVFAEEMKVKNAAFDQQLDIETEKKLQDLRAQMEIKMNGKLEKQKDTARHIQTTLEQKYSNEHTAYVEKLFQDLTKE